MGVLSLAGRLTLNSSSFEAGLKNAEQAADKFSGKLARKVGGAVLGAFTVNRLIGFTKEVIDQGVEVDRLSKKFNLTTDEVQLLQQEAKRTGTTFEELVKSAEDLESTLASLRGGEVLFSREQVEALRGASEVIQEFKDQAGINFARLLGFGGGGTPLDGRQAEFLEKDAARKRQAARDAVTAAREEKELLELEKKVEDQRVKSLPKEERLNLLLNERARFWEMRASAPFTRRGAAENELKAMQIDAAIAELQKGETAREGKSGGGLSILSDSLRSVGNFLGAGGSDATGARLNDIRKELQEIKRNTAKIGEGVMFP